MNGWICPKCNSVYSPFFPWCIKCNSFYSITESEAYDKVDECLIQNQEKESVIAANNFNKTNLKTENIINIIKNEENNKENTKIENKIICPKEIEDIIFEQPNLNKNKKENFIKYPKTKIFLGSANHAKGRMLALENDRIPSFLLDSILSFPLTYTQMTEDYMNWIKNNNIEYMLDSGIFSYLKNPNKDINLKQYIERYIDFINHFNIKKYFEIDLDLFLSLEEVEKIREYLYKKTNIMPIPVFHIERGEEYWTFMCKNYDLIAIGGLAHSNYSKKDYPKLQKMCDEAHQYNTKVHGLGFAPLELFNTKTMMFDSVDTTSWQGGRRGNHYTFTGSSLIKEDGVLAAGQEQNMLDLFQWGEFSKWYSNYGGKDNE